MFEKGANTRSKKEISVLMSLSGDEIFEATVFLLHDERLIDLLNDKRAFIPVKRQDGATIIVAKSNIISVVERRAEPHEAHAEDHATQDEEPKTEDKSEKKQTEGDAASDKQERPRKPAYEPRGHFDPYKTLRVSKDAADEEVRRAFKARMKAVHPDTLAGLDLDDEISKAAILASQRVNYAYQKIMKDRKAAAKPAPDATSDRASENATTGEDQSDTNKQSSAA
jgi:hypothetical protein